LLEVRFGQFAGMEGTPQPPGADQLEEVTEVVSRPRRSPPQGTQELGACQAGILVEEEQMQFGKVAFDLLTKAIAPVAEDQIEIDLRFLVRVHRSPPSKPRRRSSSLRRPSARSTVCVMRDGCKPIDSATSLRRYPFQ